MKKIINIKMLRLIFLITIIIGLGSCEKDWLKPKPLSIFTPESALTDARGVEGLLGFCAKTLRIEFMNGDVNPISQEMFFSDVSVCGKTITSRAPFNHDLLTPTSELNDAPGNWKLCSIGWFWEDFYKVIKTTNVIISRIDDIEFKNEAERNRVLGNAYFYRAYCYYRLVHQFGDIPFVGREVTFPKLDFYSTKRDVILEKIKKDLDWAVQYTSDNVDRGRPTRGACYHLLTKINLALGYFDDAIASANSVINGGVYSLVTTPIGEIPKERGNYLTEKLGIIRDDVIARLHWPANKALGSNKEVLFMVLSRDEFPSSSTSTGSIRNLVPFWSGTSPHMIFTPDRVGPSMSENLNEEYQLVESIGRGVGCNRPTWYSEHLIWDDPNDLRHKRGNWLSPEDLVYNNSKVLKGKNPYYGQHLQKTDASGNVLTTDTIEFWFGWPHYKAYNLSSRLPKPTGGAADQYIFRLAETYLLRAEAFLWKDDLPNAMADINAVRTRAGCAPYTDPSKIDIETVLAERARELFYEEPRFTELGRISWIFAITGKSFDGKTYSLDNYYTDNFFYDIIMKYTNYYNKGIINTAGETYKISPYHIHWPVPQKAISANVQGVINQNYGYDGYANNVPPLTSIDPEDDI